MCTLPQFHKERKIKERVEEPQGQNGHISQQTGGTAQQVAREEPSRPKAQPVQRPWGGRSSPSQGRGQGTRFRAESEGGPPWRCPAQCLLQEHTCPALRSTPSLHHHAVQMAGVEVPCPSAASVRSPASQAGQGLPQPQQRQCLAGCALNRLGVSYLVWRERGREAEPPCGTSLVARPSWPSQAQDGTAGSKVSFTPWMRQVSAGGARSLARQVMGTSALSVLFWGPTPTWGKASGWIQNQH